MKKNVHLKVTRRGNAQVWTLDRPDRFNALGPTLGAELFQALRHLQSELEPWVKAKVDETPPPWTCLIIEARPVLRDHAPPIWIAGGDLKELQDLSDAEAGRRYAELLAQVCHGLQHLPIPVLASIDGLAIGGGIELALAADLRFATERSAFHFKQLEVGLATGYASCQRLLALLGQARATDLLLRSRYVSAQVALAWCLIQELVPTEHELAEQTTALVHTFSQLSPHSLRVQKAMLHLPYQSQQDKLIQQELMLFEELWMHPWHKNFLKRFRAQ